MAQCRLRVFLYWRLRVLKDLIWPQKNTKKIIKDIEVDITPYPDWSINFVPPCFEIYCKWPKWNSFDPCLWNSTILAVFIWKVLHPPNKCLNRLERCGLVLYSLANPRCSGSSFFEPLSADRQERSIRSTCEYAAGWAVQGVVRSVAVVSWFVGNHVGHGPRERKEGYSILMRDCRWF